MGFKHHKIMRKQRFQYLKALFIHFMQFCGPWISQIPIHLSIVCFVALRPKSTAMVKAGRSDHLTILLGKLEQAVTHSVHILSLVTDNNPS